MEPTAQPVDAAAAPGRSLVRSIAVLGGGVAGWCAAAALARRLGGRCAVRLVDIGAADDPLTLAALPSAVQLHDLLSVDEDALLRASRGTFSLGTRCDGWSGGDSSYFEPFAAFGAPLGGAAFHHALLRLGSRGAPLELGDYSLAAMAAALGRFARPSEDPRSVLSTLAYGLHLAATPYARAIRTATERLGVERIAGELVGVEQSGPGAVSALILADGRRIEGELFVDATGPAARLVGQALGEPFEDWSDGWPCDGRVEVLRPSAEAPAPFATLRAEPRGWRALTPLQGAVGESFTYDRATLSDDEAAAGLGPDGDVRSRVIRRGRRVRAWVGNCVAVGEAAGLPGPDLGLHLAHSGVLRLLGLIPYRDDLAIAAAEYNRLAEAELARLRDFAGLRSRVNGRTGEALWDACRTAGGPEGLEHRLRLFESRGRLTLYEEEVFPEAHWVAILLGQGIWPRRRDVRIDALDESRLVDQLRRMRGAIRQAAEAMPTHAEFLRRCGAVATEGVPS